MPNYKDTNNNLHFLGNPEDADKYLPAGCVEITDAEAEAIRQAAIVPPDYPAEKAATLKTGRSMRETVLARLNGIHLDAIVANDTVTASAVAIAKQELKDITVHAAVVAAVTGEETKAAFLARYYEVAHALQTAAPYAVTAFTGLDL